MLNAFVISRNTPNHDRPEFFSLSIDGSHDGEPDAPYYWTEDLNDALVFVDGGGLRKVMAGGIPHATRTHVQVAKGEGAIIPIDKARFDINLARRKAALAEAEDKGVSVVED